MVSQASSSSDDWQLSGNPPNSSRTQRSGLFAVIKAFAWLFSLVLIAASALAGIYGYLYCTKYQREPHLYRQVTLAPSKNKILASRWYFPAPHSVTTATLYATTILVPSPPVTRAATPTSTDSTVPKDLNMLEEPKRVITLYPSGWHTIDLISSTVYTAAPVSTAALSEVTKDVAYSEHESSSNNEAARTYVQDLVYAVQKSQNKLVERHALPCDYHGDDIELPLSVPWTDESLSKLQAGICSPSYPTPKHHKLLPLAVWIRMNEGQNATTDSKTLENRFQALVKDIDREYKSEKYSRSATGIVLFLTSLLCALLAIGLPVLAHSKARASTVRTPKRPYNNEPKPRKRSTTLFTPKPQSTRPDVVIQIPQAQAASENPTSRRGTGAPETAHTSRQATREEAPPQLVTSVNVASDPTPASRRETAAPESVHITRQATSEQAPNFIASGADEIPAAKSKPETPPSPETN
ncbi:uncharacterized protein PV09_05124 [Verruconis gallopava]|uniref:Uncharacterized protein n=1 Tax=Verruconis gallopava TaxID=253628 RepID=A0A0D2AB49_9PEZI|nr:uncharacterized protein PV09_05124 [Verruconis gallopava]KIW03825.1 hypothetical protein PV09_05124 [Verruconis gallopava]